MSNDNNLDTRDHGREGDAPRRGAPVVSEEVVDNIRLVKRVVRSGVEAPRLPQFSQDGMVPEDWGLEACPPEVLDAEPPPATDHPESWSLIQLPQRRLSSLKFERSIVRLTQPRAGEALWVAWLDGDRDGTTRKVGVAFKWALFGTGQVLHVDPPSTVTNMLLTGDDGRCLEPPQHLASVCTLLYVLPWQEEVLQFLKWRSDQGKKIGGDHLEPPRALTPIEQECLMYAAGGKSTRVIAEKIGRAANTVEQHLKSCRQKLHCDTIAHAVYRARVTGWL